MKNIILQLIPRKHLVILFITALLLFSPLAFFSFLIGWDDQIYVLNNYTENGLAIKNIYAILCNFYYGQYAPLNQLYYSAVFELSGYNTVLFHVLSIIIHIANAFLVYVLIHKFNERLLPPGRDKRQITLCTSLLFLIAPINLEPVAWIAASKVLLFAFFYLCSLLWYIKYVETGSSKYYYLTLLAFVLSFAAKEQALTLPLAMVLIDYAYTRNFKKSMLWFEKMPPAFLSMLFVLASFQSQNRFILTSADNYTGVDRLILACYTISEYFVKIIVPVNISYVYPFPFLPGAKPPLWLWSFPVCLIAAAICLKRILLQRHVFLGIVFFLIHIIMVSNLVSLSRYSIVANRYAYIPSIGLLWLLTIAGTQLLQRTLPVIKAKYSLVLLAYCGYFFLYTGIHLWVWQNANTLKHKVRTAIKSRSDYGK